MLVIDDPIAPCGGAATEIDPASRQAAAFIVDLEPATPDAVVRVPVIAGWQPRFHVITVQPDGVVLAPGHRYAESSRCCRGGACPARIGINRLTPTREGPAAQRLCSAPTARGARARERRQELLRRCLGSGSAIGYIPSAHLDLDGNGWDPTHRSTAGWQAKSLLVECRDSLKGREREGAPASRLTAAMAARVAASGTTASVTAGRAGEHPCPSRILQ